MATLTVQKVSRDGLTPTYQLADANGDAFVNNERVFAHYKNTDAASHRVFANAIFDVYQIPEVGPATVADIDVTVPATTGDKMISFPLRPFSSQGIVNVTYPTGVAAGFTVGVFELPRS